MKNLIVWLPVHYIETLIRILEEELNVLERHDARVRNRAILKRLYAAKDSAK